METNTYKLCYDRCSSCDKGGNKSNNNCNECLKDNNNNYIYHFLHDEKGKCISEDEKPLNTYLDLATNTYELCYEKCSQCDKGGDLTNHNCKECLKDESGNYIYHFIYNNNGRCVSEVERPLNSYYDKETNTFRLCYDSCSLCDKKGDKENNNCQDCVKDENNNYLYHFVFNEPGKCLSDKEKPSNMYLNKDTNTYELCFERCSSCDIKGDESNNNCNECYKDENNIYRYHFIFNETGKCLSDEEKPSNMYLDKETNTYELCYDRCSSCSAKGNKSANNCKECLKDKNNNYIYHFVYNETGKCITDDEKPSNTYFDKESNTFKLCSGTCNSCESFAECKECLKDESNNYIYHFIYDEKGKCIDESGLKNGFYYLDASDNTYKACPEGTNKVENDQCIEDNTETIILVFIIIIVIIIVLIPLLFHFMKSRNNKIRDEKMKELIIN